MSSSNQTKFEAPVNNDDIPLVDPVHYLPFHIEHNGPAMVESRFTSLINFTNPKALTVEFRGRPLVGEKLKILDDYEGIIVTQTSPPKSKNDQENKEKTLKISGTFNEYTYWNWDKPPSGMDDPVKLNDWLEIANQLHKPIQVERN